MQPFHGFSGPWIHRDANPRTDEGLIKRVVQIRHLPDALEYFFRVPESLELLDLTFLEMHLVLGLATIGVPRRIIDLHLVEPGRERLDVVEAVEDRPVLQPCNARRNEDAQMTDVWVGQIDDALPGVLEGMGVREDRRNPAERLMGRRDVDTIGREDDQRIADVAKIDAAMLVDPHPALLQLVADEEILDDRHHLLAAEPMKPTPPSLELEKALALRVDIRE